MSDIREKIMAIEPKQKIENIYKAWFDVGKRVAADIAEAEVQRLEDANFHLASWQCPFTDGKKGLVNSDNGDQYCAMEREVARLEARVRELEERLS